MLGARNGIINAPLDPLITESVSCRKALSILVKEAGFLTYDNCESITGRGNNTKRNNENLETSQSTASSNEDRGTPDINYQHVEANGTKESFPMKNSRNHEPTNPNFDLSNHAATGNKLLHFAPTHEGIDSDALIVRSRLEYSGYKLETLNMVMNEEEKMKKKAFLFYLNLPAPLF
ncbi:hypothetical protein LguiB_030675 [Lonicera macranthoides]